MRAAPDPLTDRTAPTAATRSSRRLHRLAGVQRLTRYVELGDNHGYRIVVDESGQISLTAQQGPPGPVSNLTMVGLTLTPEQCQELIALLNTAISLAGD